MSHLPLSTHGTHYSPGEWVGVKELFVKVNWIKRTGWNHGKDCNCMDYSLCNWPDGFFFFKSSDFITNLIFPIKRKIRGPFSQGKAMKRLLWASCCAKLYPRNIAFHLYFLKDRAGATFCLLTWNQFGEPILGFGIHVYITAPRKGKTLTSAFPRGWMLFQRPVACPM